MRLRLLYRAARSLKHAMRGVINRPRRTSKWIPAVGARFARCNMIWWILSGLLLLLVTYVTYVLFLSKDPETKTSLNDFIKPGKFAQYLYGPDFSGRASEGESGVGKLSSRSCIRDKVMIIKKKRSVLFPSYRVKAKVYVDRQTLVKGHCT